MKISKSGIEFDWHGDWVLWLYPWKRSSFENRFISFGFEGVFTSLNSIDDLWDEYFEALRK